MRGWGRERGREGERGSMVQYCVVLSAGIWEPGIENPGFGILREERGEMR